MRTNRSVILLIFLMLFTAGPAYCQSGVILDSQRAKLFGEIGADLLSSDRAAPAPGDAGGGGGGDGGVVFKIIQIQNLQGNNPFNAYQPVFNYNGIVVADVDALLSCVRGGACQAGGGAGGGGGTIICQPSSATSNAAAFKDSVGIYIIGNTCRVEQTTGTSTKEALYALWDTITSFILAGTNTGFGTISEYTMTIPPAPNTGTDTWATGTMYRLINNTPTITVVQHGPTGVKYRITFRVTRVGFTNDVTLFVTSVTTVP